MKSKNISGQPPGGKRNNLSEILPLDTPFVIQVFPIYACNFKCKYCIFSVDKKDRGFISDKIIMDFNLYKKFIDDISTFPNKIKVLRFVGIGEPLLHKNIADMVSYAISKDVADTVEILTNASLLTHEMSDSLINAGLTRLVVSLQGTSKEKYREISGVDIDFEKFIDNLKYFYDNKGKSHMYIKIIDCALDKKNNEQSFFNLFGDVCDTMAIEHMIPIHSSINYNNKDINTTQFGLPVPCIQVCPQPFFTMQINPDGKIVPCYSWDYPVIIGDCNTESMVSIWNGNKLQKFRLQHLYDMKCPTCKNCNISKYRGFSEDNLDNDIDRLKGTYN